MNIEKNIREDHTAELIVDVDPERMEAAKRRAARKLAERGKIPGFRPGKAPYEMIRKHYGDEAIFEQAVDILVDTIYPEILDQAEIKPSAMGSLEKIESIDPPKFIFRVPLMPTVDLGDYLAIRHPYEWTAPGPDKLNQSLDEMRQMYGSTDTVERAAAEGDYLLLDAKGEKKDAAEDEVNPELSREGFATIIRAEDKQRDEEWPFKGFARELVGLQPGENKKVKHKFPKDFEDEKLQGATVTYDVTMKIVRGVTLPELNDDFAKMVSAQYENLEQLKEALGKDVEERSKAEYDDAYYAKLIDLIKEGATIKYPPQVVEHEAGHVIQDLQQRLGQQGMDLPTYFKVRNTTQEKFTEEEVMPVAKKRLERSLVLDEIARTHKVSIDEESLHAEFNQTIAQLATQGMDINGLNKGSRKSQQQFSTAVANESATRLMTRRALEKLKTIATGAYDPEVEAREQAEAEVNAIPAPSLSPVHFHDDEDHEGHDHDAE